MSDSPAATSGTSGARPGGRAARVVASVLEATQSLLVEVGYNGLSIDEVAARAGVHKTTIYRRWPSKPELVAAAVSESSRQGIPVPDTGALGTDLAAFAKSIVRFVGDSETAGATRSLLAAANDSDELMAVSHGYWAERMANAAPIVTRAIERGELAAEVDPAEVIEAVIGPIWVRLLLTGEPITEGLADRTAALITAGLVARSSAEAPKP